MKTGLIWRYSLITLAAALLAFALAACGGGGTGAISPQLSPTQDAPGSTLDWSQAVRSGSYMLLAVDASERNVDPRTAQLELTVEPARRGETLAIRGSGLESSAALFLHLRYDPQASSPGYVNQGADIEGHALLLGITEPADYVALGIAALDPAAPLDGDMELARIEFRDGPRQPSRAASQLPSEAVDDLRFSVANPETLRWTYKSPGDYDQNSEVGIADIVPISIHYLKNTSAPDWNEAQVVDGDNNGEVNAGDMVIIAQNYLNRVAGYQVQGGANETGPFNDTALVEFSAAAGPDGGGYLEFSHELATAVQDAWYVVLAVNGDERASQHSNAVQYNPSQTINPPTSLSVTTDGTNLSLSWQAPAGNLPDSYIAYVSTDSTMSSPFDITGITGTTYQLSPVFSPDNEYWFGVKALYDTTLSDYSNIFHYEPGGSGTPAPSGLSVVQSGGQLAATWDAPTGNTPMHYDLFISDNSGMTGATNAADDVVSTSATLSPVFGPDSEWYLGVKANYTEGTSDYSNIFHYTPGGTGDDTAPSWNGGLPDGGIKTAVGGNASASISWWEAADAGSPPVTYLIYYAETSTGIDWGTHQDTASAGTTAMVIEGLTNDVSYDFGVRARDASGNTTTNTNVLAAIPSASGVPIDTGTWQSSELVDNGGVLPQQDTGWFTDIDVKADGTIGVAHHNESAGDLLYSEQPGGSGPWTTTTVYMTGQTGSWPDLEFSPDTGHPCIAFHDEDEAALKYAEYDGSEWTITTIDAGGDKGAFASLEFNPATNNPGIAYFDAISNDVRFATFDGSIWDIEVAFNGGPEGLGLTGAYCDLRFDPDNDYPAIAYTYSYEMSLSMTATNYTWWTGTGWSTQTAILGPYNDIEIDTAGYANSLVFTDSGSPRIITVESLGEVIIGEPAGGIWTETTVGNTGSLAGGAIDYIYTDIEFYDGQIYWVFYNKDGGSIDYGSGFATGTTLEGSGNGGFPSLEIGTDGTQYAAYLDSTGSKLKVARMPSGGSWSIETAVDMTGGEGVVGENASLVFDPSGGFPMISYYDASNSALKFADRQPGSWRAEIVANQDNDGSFNGIGVLGDGSAFIGFFSVSTAKTALKSAEGSFGSWDISTIFESNIQTGGDAKGNYCAVGIQDPPTSNPGIAFHNTTQRRLEFAQLDNAGGSDETTVDEFNDPGRFNSVAYNPANNFAGLAYYARDNQDLRFVQRAGNGDWAPVTVDSGGVVGNRCSLVYGANTARPWISYYDESNHRLKVAYVDDGDDWATDPWQYVTIDAPGGSSNYGSYSSIGWHPVHNRAAVVFYDADNGKLWYQFIGDPAAPQGAVEIAGAAGNEGLWPSLTFDPDTGHPAVAYMDVDNGDLRYIMRADS